MLDTVRNYVESYGLRLSDRADRTISEMNQAAEVAGEALARVDRPVMWRMIGPEPEGEPAKEFTTQVDRLSALLTSAQESLDNPGAARLDPAQEHELSVLLATLSPTKAPSFVLWLRLRQALLIRPILLFHNTDARTAALIREACPTVYLPPSKNGGNNDEDGAMGFIQPLAEIVRDAKAEAVVNWCQRPQDARMKEDTAGVSSLLLAWYWMDQGEMLRGKDAILTLVDRARDQAAQAAPASEDKFLYELRMFRAMAASSSIMADLPGIAALRLDFSDALAPLLEDWGRRWMAAGHYGPHAGAEVDWLKGLVGRNRGQAIAATSSWKAQRYYFVDYRGSFGTIPNSLRQSIALT
jgi:hypothetical protein